MQVCPKTSFPTLVGGGDIGAALLEQDIAGIYFTGSHATGVKVAQAASKKLDAGSAGTRW